MTLQHDSDYLHISDERRLQLHHYIAEYTHNLAAEKRASRPLHDSERVNKIHEETWAHDMTELSRSSRQMDTCECTFSIPSAVCLSAASLQTNL